MEQYAHYLHKGIPRQHKQNGKTWVPHPKLNCNGERRVNTMTYDESLIKSKAEKLQNTPGIAAIPCRETIKNKRRHVRQGCKSML